MSTKFKPGDQVKFNSEEVKRWKRENQWYHGYPFTLEDIFTIKRWNGHFWEIVFGSDPTIYQFDDFSLELAEPQLTQQDRIIRKINYLNTRFLEQQLKKDLVSHGIRGE